MPTIMKILVDGSGLAPYEILRIVRNAPNRYKRYFIRKRNGGSRSISHPAKELKILQRILVDAVISKFPVHPAATAYRSGLSVRHNALPHAGLTMIKKMDFRDFFPSLTEADWQAYCRETKCLEDHEDIEITTQLLFQRQPGSRTLRMAIGAPSSPSLSNALMFEFDKLITDRVGAENIVYTRYADDLTFSAPRTGYLTSVEPIVRTTLNDISTPAQLTINKDKTTTVTMKYARKITGVVLSNDGRVTIGRDKKRLIRAGIHNFVKSSISDDDIIYIAGQIAFAKSAEPDFFDAICRRHGKATINSMLSKAGQLARRGA